MAFSVLSKHTKPLMQASLRQAGFAVDEIITHWGVIVGEDLAENTLPLKIIWGKRALKGEAQAAGTLHILVEPAFMLELEYQKHSLLEKVNRYFGWQAVQAIKFKQGRIPLKMKPAFIKPSLQIIRKTEKIVGEVEDEALKKALIALGSNILALSMKTQKEYTADTKS